MAWRRLRKHGAAIASIVLAVLAGACGGAVEEMPLQDIVDDPQSHLGETVTVEGAVSNPIDHRVWEMAGGRIFVIYDRGLERGLQKGETLRVTGAVRKLDKNTIEGELGIDIEAHFFDEPVLEDDVAFVAESVTRLER